MKFGRVSPAQLIFALRIVWDSSPGWAAAGAGLLLVNAALALASLAALKFVIDGVAAAVGSPDTHSAFASLAILVALAALIMLLAAVCNSADYAIGEIQRDLVSDHLQSLVHGKAVAVDLEYYDRPQYEDMLHRVQTEGPHRTAAILTSLLQALRSGILLAAIAGLVFAFNWWVALLLVVGDLPGAYIRIRNALDQYRWEQAHAPLDRQARYYNILLGPYFAQDIRLLDLGGLFIERFRALRKQLRGERRRLIVRRASFEFAGHLAAALAMYGVYGIVAYQALAGTITMGDVVMYFAAFQRAHGHLVELFFGLARSYENSLFLADLARFLALEEKVADPDCALPVPRSLSTGIAFEHVDFCYPGADLPALRDVNLTARPGERIAIVGPNGSGKTTIVKLLCRLYDPCAGRITADGIPLSCFAKEEWRHGITVFAQDYGKYQLAARENIWFGDCTSTQDDTSIAAAARRSGAHGLIQHLPHGYATILGTAVEYGVKLSAGEWQKVALARTYLRNAQVVILDEPTNAMDALSEQKALEAVWTLAPDVITILITHRLSSVRFADRIYVLAEGRVAESGTHGELMRRGGKYADLFATQARNYL